MPRDGEQNATKKCPLVRRIGLGRGKSGGTWGGHSNGSRMGRSVNQQKTKKREREKGYVLVNMTKRKTRNGATGERRSDPTDAGPATRAVWAPGGQKTTASLTQGDKKKKGRVYTVVRSRNPNGTKTVQRGIRENSEGGFDQARNLRTVGKGCPSAYQSTPRVQETSDPWSPVARKYRKKTGKSCEKERPT